MGNAQARVHFPDSDDDDLTLRHGEKLSDITLIYGAGYLRNAEDGSVILAQDIRIPKGSYEFIQKKSAVWRKLSFLRYYKTN